MPSASFGRLTTRRITLTGARPGARLPNLKPSSQTISIRLPKPMLDRLKLLANKRDVPYQSLLKMFVADRLKAEFKS